VIWGALHGIYLIAGAATMKQREQVWERIEAWIDAPAPATGAARAGFAPPTLPPALLGTARWGAALKKVWRVFVTFHLVLVAWVFFRANSLADALTLLGNTFGGSTPLLVPGVAAYGMALSLLGIAALLVVHLVERRGALADVLDTQPTAVRWGVYYAMILSIFLFGVFGQQQFIYFQF
jgi:D-alanyl-lipoteichoic acid acyltransferase DltB (MBOAT superfamily)